MKSKKQIINSGNSFSKTMLYIRNCFKYFDLYGKPVTLTYKGNEKFKTFLGGFISFWILILVFSYMIILLRVITKKSGTSQSKNSLKRTLNYDTEVHHIYRHGFDFSFILESDDTDYLLDPSYVTMEIS